MIERRTWVVTVWQGVLAAVWVLVLAFIAYASANMRDVSVLLAANHRASIATMVRIDEQRLRESGKPFAAIASALVDKVDSDRSMTAVVADDTGKYVAGDKSLLADAAIPFTEKFGVEFHMPSPPAGTVPPQGFALQAPPEVGFGTFGPPGLLATGPSVSMIRLNGGWLVFAEKSTEIAALGAWYWPVAAGLVVLAFATVWSVGRRTLVQSVRPMARVERGLRRMVDVNTSAVEAIATEDTGLAAPLVESYNAAALELAEVLKQSAELEAQIRKFVADAGHELRTPLAVIMGYVQLLRQRGGADSEIVERIFSEIEGQGHRMTLLIQKLLLLTRLESQEPRDVKVFDAGEIASSVADSFRPLTEAPIAFHGNGSVLIKASEVEFRDSLGNLIDNAIKYAPGAAIDVTVGSADGAVAISVSDHGPGMTPDVRARAFERFSRGETAGAIPGSGLGLAIVETAVKRAGGTVSLRTSHGQGTSVEMRFPAWRANSDARA